MFVSIINLLRLLFIALISLLILPFTGSKAIYLFLYLAGPSFIKLGQSLATRPDVIGDKTAKILAKFQDRITPFKAKKVKKILNKQFGNNFSQIFIDFDYNSIASASIAQVHKAKIYSNNELKMVAVKILRPNIEKNLKRDIVTISFLASILKLFDKFSAKFLLDIAELLENTTRSECDLLREAANATKLKQNLAKVNGFYVPNIFWNLSSKGILVLEWIDGTPLSNKEELNKINFNRQQIAKNLVLGYFNQVYIDGFFHADMHPGNLFLMKNGNIAVVDFGIMGIIDKKTRLIIAQIFLGFINRDYQKIAKLHIEGGLVPQDTNIDDLALSCCKIGETIVDISVKDIVISRLLTALIEITRQYQMKTKPELLLLQKTLLLVEGVGIMLDENLNIWDLARPWVREWANTHLGFDAKIYDATIDFIGAIKKIIKNINNNFSLN